MSNIYVQEPPTDGKVLLVTTVGDIDIELWSKEAPKACRNFVQLCMEGYYDDMTFFRVVRNFIVQGGDPTGTGHGGESIYGKPFQDEFHSRLRFVRRGLVAMANAGLNDNTSQFFFTLAATPELSNKHTIFGRVAGNTVFNMIKLGEVATDNEDRPINPLKIIRTKVLNSPFKDIVPRIINTKATKEKTVSNETSCKATKNFSLLSFGEEAEEDEQEVSKATETLRHKAKSSHDLLNDAKLSSVPAVDISNDSKKQKAHEIESDEEGGINTTENHTEHEISKVEKQSGEEKKKMWHKAGETSEKLKGIVYKKEKLSASTENELPPKLKGKDREDATRKLLEKFQSELEAMKMLPVQEEDKEHAANEEQLRDQAAGDMDLGWMNHKLQFEEKEHKVIDANIPDSERYEISDPRNPMVVRRRHKDKHDGSEKRQKTESK